jgi:hypothetical protein
MPSDPKALRRNQLRMVVRLCCSFGRNLAYYRAWWGDEHQHFLSLAHSHGDFWVAVNNNFFDMCVLDWCKLFARKSEKHYWGNVASDQSKFEADLLHHLDLDASAFKNQIHTMSSYRDKFIAHQDLERKGEYPTLDAAKKAAWFYHTHIVNNEARRGDLTGLILDIEKGFQETVQEGLAVYRGIR